MELAFILNYRRHALIVSLINSVVPNQPVFVEIYCIRMQAFMDIITSYMQHNDAKFVLELGWGNDW